MNDCRQASLSQKIDTKVFHTVGGAADTLGRECYVVGGYVRDLMLGRHSKDIDFVTVGSGIELAQRVAAGMGPHTLVHIYRTYGTAQIKRGDMELEFVGARRESYHAQSRNPIIEDGTLDDDISRRDFTINAMALCVNASRFGELIDRFGGVDDLRTGIIRTPLDPDITFSDDPLRMMRAIRFATQLNFTIHPLTFEAITRNARRIEIITRERIATELEKIMLSPRPSIGWRLLEECGLLRLIFPELQALRGVETVNGRGHKDNFYHTLQVLDNVAAATAVNGNLWLRWAALLHDIGKPATKRWDEKLGWTFHNHNFIGSKMVPRIFSRMKLPLDSRMKYVQKLVDMHMRPMHMAEEEITDSAVRRLINYAGDDLADLMTLARADITSKNIAKKQRYLDNFDIVDRKFDALKLKDEDARFRPALNGDDIRRIFGLPQCPTVGAFMKPMTQAAKDCEIENTPQGCLDFLLALAPTLGITPVDPTI